MSLSRKTLEHPVLILIVFALLGMIGIFTLSNVAIALMPEVENPSLSINTSYPTRISQILLFNNLYFSC